jgi:hypothetical protein
MLTWGAMISWMDVIGLNPLFCWWNLVFCSGCAGLSDLNKLNLACCFVYVDQLDMQKLMSLWDSYIKFPICNHDN